MRTRKKIAASLMAELKTAYAAIDAQPPYFDDPAGNAEAIGVYDGLKRAYVLLTGRSQDDVAYEVVHWYIGTPEYQAAKERGAEL